MVRSIIVVYGESIVMGMEYRPPTTTSTDPIFEIFPGYQLQFSGFGTEAQFHGTSFTSGIS